MRRRSRQKNNYGAERFCSKPTPQTWEKNEGTDIMQFITFGGGEEVANRVLAIPLYTSWGKRKKKGKYAAKEEGESDLKEEGGGSKKVELRRGGKGLPSTEVGLGEEFYSLEKNSKRGKLAAGGARISIERSHGQRRRALRRDLTGPDFLVAAPWGASPVGNKMVSKGRLERPNRGGGREKKSGNSAIKLKKMGKRRLA